VKKYKNDKFRVYIHQIFLVQGQKLLQLFDNDFQALVDECIKINPHGVKPGVEFHVEKVLFSGRTQQHHQLQEDEAYRQRYETSPINEEYYTRSVEEMDNDEESTPHDY
jgi:hypothetical protein